MPPAGVPVLSLVALNTASLAHAARMYADQGFPVFPLVPRDKRPRVARGFYRATTNVAQVRRWWSAWPDANIGLATGKPSGLWVLDIDPRHGGLCSLERLEQHVRERGETRAARDALATDWRRRPASVLPDAVTVRGSASTGAFADYQGIECKQAGGYIVAPPSRHPSGRVYQWQGDAAPAPFPAALLDVWADARQLARAPASSFQEMQPCWRSGRASPLVREHDPTYWLQVAVHKAAPGSRHRYACFLAIQLVRTAGCSFAEAESWMRVYVAQVAHHPTDPYELSDALRCLRYAWGKYAS